MRRIQYQNPFRFSALALAVATTAGIATPALAQEQATGVEEVVVTAQRREESLQDTPISITAFTESKLSELGVFDVSQVGNFAPNVTIQKQPGATSNMGVNMRGVGMGETSLLADPKVGFYIDGVFMSKTVGGVFDVVDLERIEVLRGPQGTLFGRNTTGGAINVTTKKPTGEFGLKLDGSVGNYGYQRAGASIDLPKFWDISAKVSVNRVKYDGWAENHWSGDANPPAPRNTGVPDELGNKDNWAGRLALRWEPREDLTVDYAYDYTDNRGVPTPFQIVDVHDSLYNGFTVTPVPFTFIGGQAFQQMEANIGDPKKRQDDFNLDFAGEDKLDVEGHTLTVAWEVRDDLTLKYIGGMRSTDYTSEGTDLDGGALTARDLFYGSFAGNNDPIPVALFHSRIDKGTIDTDTHELQVIGNLFSDKLFYTGGLFYYKEEVAQVNPQTFALPIEFILRNPAANTALRPLYNAFGYCIFGGAVCPGTQKFPFGPTDTYTPGVLDFIYGGEAESWAAYGQATYSITEDFDLTAGVRYTEDEKTNYIFNQTMTGTTPSNPAEGDDKWDNVSYMVNGNYALTDDINVYLKYSTGYNGGGFNARAATIASFQTPYAEEEVEVWELGLKSEWWDNRVRFNAAVFTNDYSDIQIAQFDAGSGGASSNIVNAGQGTYEGFEFELVVVPVDGLTIDANYGYLDAEFDEYEARNPVTNQLEDISNVTTVAQAPENSANLGVQYDFAPMDFGQLSMRVDVAYKDEFVFHPFQNQYDSADDRTLVNARISLNDIQLGDGALRISAWGKNLTDEEYREWGIDFGSLGFAGDTWGEPTTYGLDVTYTYQ